MTVFSTLISLQLRDAETFEQFERRVGLLTQRLCSWVSPVILSEQLLLFCALHTLPSVPHGPVCHMILITPVTTHYNGMTMSKDVVNAGDNIIESTFDSDNSSSKSSTSVLHAREGDSQQPRNHRSRRQNRQPKKDVKKKSLHLVEGSYKHHGPDPKHVTSECRDPTSSRRK